MVRPDYEKGERGERWRDGSEGRREARVTTHPLTYPATRKRRVTRPLGGKRASVSGTVAIEMSPVIHLMPPKECGDKQHDELR